MTCPIVIVGEFPDQTAEARGLIIGGPQGQVLRGLLSQAGLSASEIPMTNVFSTRPPRGDIETLCTSSRAQAVPNYPYIKRGHYLRAEHGPAIAALWHFLERHNPNVILALGNVAMWALCKQMGIEKWRGTATLTHDKRWKVITTWPPASILKQWNLRPIAFADISKTKRESETARLVRPRRILHLDPTLEDIKTFYHEHVVPAEFLSCDIETKADTITEVGFATSPSRAIVIPFWSRARGNYWPTPELERAAWEWVRRFLVEKPTIGQNFQYDMQYLYRKMGIACPQFAGDTMLLHHSLQPELKKGLGFLASIYTSEPSWKFMRTEHSTLKREDE